MAAAAKEEALYFDGGSRGNPGVTGSGAAHCKDGAFINAATVYVGDRSTNNVAEYHGAIAAAAMARDAGVKRLVLRGDSQLVIKQIKGEYQVRAPHLQPLHAELLDILAGFESTKLEWIPEDENAMADALSNVAMDSRETDAGKHMVAEATAWIAAHPAHKKAHRKRKAPAGAAAGAADKKPKRLAERVQMLEERVRLLERRGVSPPP